MNWLMIPRISNLPLTVYNVHSENSKCFINISSYQRKVKSSLATKTLLMKQIHVSLQRWSPVERCHPSNIFPQGTVLDSDHEPTVHFRQRSLIFPASLKGYRIINLAIDWYVSRQETPTRIILMPNFSQQTPNPTGISLAYSLSEDYLTLSLGIMSNWGTTISECQGCNV